MPNWDDDFDFQDDQDNNKKNKPKNNNKKTKNVEDDFFDLEDNNKKEAKSSLPSINQRQSAKIKPEVEINKAKNVNPYAQKFFGKNQKNQQQDYYEQVLQEVDEQPKNIVKPKQNKKTKTKEQEEQQNYEQDYEEPIQSIKPQKKQLKLQIKKEEPAKNNKKVEPTPMKNLSNISNTKSQVKKEQQYEEEFQDGYGQDFEQLDKSPQKTQPSKDTIKPKANNLTPSVQKNPPKPPQNPVKGNTNSVVSNKNLNKIGSHSVNKQLVRNNSRHSIKSNDSRRLQASRSKSIRKNQSEYIPNKHADIVQKSFPEDQNQIRTYNQDKIIKTNERMRAMIRKFNQQLNQLINKNMMLLKSKTNEKQHTVEDRIKELQIQKRSGDTAIDVMEKQFQKLYGRQGELKQEQYQLILQKKISQMQVTIKQATKQITLMKRDVDTNGKKLSVKQQQIRDAQNIHHIKTVLIQAKKDEQSRDDRISKLDHNYEELRTKLSDIDYQMEELINQAKQKGINIQNNDLAIKKFDQLKKRLETIKNYNSKSQNLIKTKIDILNHENDQIRITIKNIHSQVNNLVGSIDHAHNQAVKIIEKAKENPNLNQLFSQNLDKLLRQIQEAKINNEYQGRSQTRKSGRSQSINKPLKNSMADNIQKSLPLRSEASNNKVSQNSSPKSEQVNLVKPKFTKKKPGSGLDIQNKHNQRIWNQEDDKNKINIKKQVPKPIEVIEQPVAVQQKKDKIKPFSIKKNKDKTQISEEKKQIPVQNIQKVEQQKKEEPLNINVAPRMMKFGRKKEDSKNDISLNSNNTKDQIGAKQQIKKNQQVKEEEDKPIFAPKRFNLRNKVEKKEDSYAPTIQQKKLAPVQQISKPKQEYKPKLDFKNQTLDKPKLQQKVEEYKPKFNFKKQEQIKPKAVQEEIKIQNDQIKPKVNLRLRDRLKKQQTQDDSYNPTIQVKQKQVKKQLSPQNNNNPYAPKSNPYAPKKQEYKTVGLNLNQKVKKEEQPISNPSNPYAPKQQTNNPYAPKQQVNIPNPYAPKIQTNNPYAPKQQANNPYIPSQGLKREKGPLKKQKPSINGAQKQKINIYQQVEDATVILKDEQKSSPQKNLNSYNNQANNNEKSQQLDLNAMLGIKKQNKKSDFDDLLGDVGGNKKQKKKKDDFFGDLDI